MSDQSTLKDELKAEWEARAEDWISRIQDIETSHREAMLDGWMLDAIGDVADRKVIDLGCGEGSFSRMLAERGAVVTGLDLCRPLIEFARMHRVTNEAYLIGDMEDLNELPENEFEVAISYISLVDVSDMQSAVREAFRILCPDGLFVVCNLHPMISASLNWIKQGSLKLHYPVDHYFDEGERDIARQDDQPWTMFHRTLSTHVRTFLDIGFAVEDIREPTPTDAQAARYPFVSDNLRVPEFIIYTLRKP